MMSRDDDIDNFFMMTHGLLYIRPECSEVTTSHFKISGYRFTWTLIMGKNRKIPIFRFVRKYNGVFRKSEENII